MKKIIKESIIDKFTNKLYEEKDEDYAFQIIDKCHDNFKSLKAAANNKIERYIEFVNKLKKRRSLNEYPVEDFYSLYDSEYAVGIFNDEEDPGKDSLGVFEYSNDDACELIYSTDDEEAVKSYKAFYSMFKEHIKEIKESKKEEEQQDKLKDFLKKA